MASLEEQPTTTELTEANVDDLLPATGKKIATVYKFNIAWVRAALAALEIAVEDTNDLGECKATLSTYFIKLNAAKSEQVPRHPFYPAAFAFVSCEIVLVRVPTRPSQNKFPGTSTHAHRRATPAVLPPKSHAPACTSGKLFPGS